MLERSGRGTAAGSESDAANYARRTDRILIRNRNWETVAVIEMLSPGNKEGRPAIQEVTERYVEFVRRGVSVLVVDLFSPTEHDPQGIHPVIWSRLTDTPPVTPSTDRPLAVVSYDATGRPTAYMEPIAVGGLLPDAPLFVAPGRYATIPLELAYMAEWDETPDFIRDEVRRPPAPG
jgi:hypothetical protein